MLAVNDLPWNLLCEGQSLRIENTECLQPLIDQKILEPCNRTGNWIAKAPGVFSVRGETFIVLPRLYKQEGSFTNGNLTDSIFLNMIALDRFAKEKIRRSVGDWENELSTFSHGESQSLIDYVESALLLWKDFQSNGNLTLLSKKMSTDKPGRISWPRTLRDGQPVFARTGTVFAEIHRSSLRRDVYDKLFQLHRQSCLKVGQLLGKETSRPSVFIGRQEAIEILDAYRRRCFSDRHRYVHRLLERFYRLSGGQAGSGRTSLNALFLRRFEYLWERVLQVALGHLNKAPMGLRGTYISNLVELRPSGKKSRGLHLKPDLITFDPENPEVMLILDAKDYDHNAWPGSADIAKQMLYRILLSKESGCPESRALENIGNAFLFPFHRRDSQVSVFTRGFHDLDDQAWPFARLGRIAGVEVNYELATRAYLSGKTDFDLLSQISTMVMQVA